MLQIPSAKNIYLLIIELPLQEFQFYLTLTKEKNT